MNKAEQKTIELTPELMKSFRDMISQAVRNELDNEIDTRIQKAVTKAYTQRVKIDFDGELDEMKKQVNGIEGNVREIKQVLIGDKKYGTTSGLVHRVEDLEKNNKNQEDSINDIKRYVKMATGIAGAVGGLLMFIFQLVISKIADKF